ncbi:MAG: hypothetical protein OCC45_12070 [Desulfotalea sp.]
MGYFIFRKKFFSFGIKMSIIIILLVAHACQGAEYDGKLHSDYVLVGSHQSFSCSQCHIDTSRPRITKCIDCHYRDIPNYASCNSCHTLQNQKDEQHQISHFGKHCAYCHESGNWNISINSSLEQQNCINCHEKDLPVRHYSIIQCYLCHTGSSWNTFKFDHKGFVDCVKCHSRPEEHKTGKCDSCHDIKDWSNGSYLPTRKLLDWIN